MIDTDQLAEARGVAVPPLPVRGDAGDDTALADLVAAAQIVVDNGRAGTWCYYTHERDGHQLGTNKHCALCQLANAVEPFE